MIQVEEDYYAGIAITKGRQILAFVMFNKAQANSALALLEQKYVPLWEMGQRLEKAVKEWRGKFKDPSATMEIHISLPGGIILNPSTPLSIRQVATVASACLCQNDPGVEYMKSDLAKIASGLAPKGHIYKPFLLSEGFKPKNDKY